MGRDFLVVLVWISFIWAIFNLMPVFPLDGGQLLNAILGPKRRNITHTIGILVAVALAALGLRFGYLFVALFMGYFAYQNFLHLQDSQQR